MKSKLFFILAVVLAIVLTLTVATAGCKKAEESTTETEPAEEESAAEETAEEAETVEAEPVTLTIWDWQNAENYLEAFDEIFALYKEDHPNVDFDHKVVTSTDYMQMLKAAITGNELPQIFEVWTGMQIAEYHSALLDLTDIIFEDSEWNDWVGKQASALDVQYEGKTYLVPIDMWDVGVYCNNKILDDYGLEIPNTIDDLISMVPVLGADDIKPLSSNFQDVWTAQFIFTVFIHQIEPEGSGMQMQAEAGEISWNNPTFIEACEGIKKMWDNGVFRSDAFARAYNIDGIAEFTDQKCMGLWAGGDWYTGTVVDAGIDATAIPFPLIKEGAVPTYLASNGLAYATYPDNPDMEVSLDFMKFLSSPEVSKIFVKNSIHPAAKVPEGTEIENPLLKQVIETAPNYKEANPWVYNADVSTAITDGLANYVLGVTTVEEFLDSIDAAMQ